MIILSLANTKKLEILKKDKNGLPMLLAGLIAGLVISIFQATTQINEMTLSFVPKIILVVVILIFLMPWMTTTMIDFTENILNQIPTFIK